MKGEKDSGLTSRFLENWKLREKHKLEVKHKRPQMQGKNKIKLYSIRESFEPRPSWRHLVFGEKMEKE